MMADQVLQTLRDDLANGRPSERQNALTRLGGLAPKGAAEWVVPLLADNDLSVRIDALICLQELREPATIPHLVAAAEHGRSAEEREFAVLSLSAFTSAEVRSCLLTVLADSSLNNNGRMRAVMQLWRYPDEAVVKVLQYVVLNDSNDNVRLHAADSLVFVFRALNCPEAWKEFWTRVHREPRIGVVEIAEEALRLLRERQG